MSRLPATVTFRIDPKTRKALQAEADLRHMSEGALVLLYVEQSLGRETTTARLTNLETRVEVLEQLALGPGQEPAAEQKPATEPDGN